MSSFEQVKFCRTVIFLDIDGVLNNDEFLGDIDRSKESKWDDFWINNLDARSMRILNEIISRTNASVVISSTWRLMLKIDDLKEIFEISGFKGDIIGYTPYLQGMSRGKEIIHWLLKTKHDVDKYIIIDDVNDFKDTESLLPSFMKTECDEGLMPHHIGQAVTLLAELNSF
jgi:hypothetical protein